MSDFVSDFDFSAFLAADETTFDVNWQPPIGDDFDFSALLALGDGTLDPSLPLQPMLPWGEATDFPTLLPAGTAWDRRMQSREPTEAEVAISQPANELVDNEATVTENIQRGRMIAIEQCQKFNSSGMRSKRAIEPFLAMFSAVVKRSSGKVTCRAMQAMLTSLTTIKSKQTIQMSVPNAAKSIPLVFNCRLDVLHRHIDSYANAMPKFPCSFCKLHRGRHGFRRRDHLVQHLRGYHQFDSEEINQAVPAARSPTTNWVHPVCPHSGCEHHRGESFYELSQQEQIQQRPFGKRSELTKHLKDDHGETPFPCDVPGCDKIGAKGYVREKDCMKHRVAKHPDAGPYVPAARISRIKCNIPGCGKTFKSSQSLGSHRSWVHYGYRKEIDPFV
ncbi:uncharacterized protein JN550_009188 [Neoarthrinium moseri]|uniref:uncharacterized protein n=1 Tax=Neoarthrinium moseri TaxID=1658444 RepID=UPI001FDD5908|nr:uncharacterized protein JN550_009188 [Neoarthrinium moseri]KAI1863909.1 hypothetical protein JN550_009188 [Neoarthrinium moseri]